MSPLNALFSLDLALALTLVVIASLAEPILAWQVNRRLDGNHVFHWSFDHLLQPLARATVIAGFVLIAYPALYGAHIAPSIGTLLEQGSLRFGNLINVLFLCSLVLPVLPLFSNRAGLMVPLQGLIAVAMVFAWYTDYLGATSASWWPGWSSALAVGAMAYIAHRVAAELGHALGRYLDRVYNTSGLDRIVANAIEALAQTPVLLYYGLTLGRQIGI